MTAIMQMLTFLGDHFYFVLIAFFEILAALALLVWPKCRRTAHAGAFLLPEEEQMLLQEIGRDASEAFLLMRRYDSMVLGAVGDVQALLGVSLQQLQDDVTAMYRNIKNPELGSRMERSYRAWRCEKPLEYELEMADGQWLHMSIAPCRNPAYELVHFHLSTAMHERERGYEQRLDKAEAASQFKTSFLFRMSHEIRTPMNGIIGMLTLMKGKIPADHAAMQYVEKAEELSDHMLSLINDILDMSRIEAGKVELENAPFSLRAFGKTLDDMFARQMEKKGVAFAVRYEELTADWVLGDSLRLNQVVINFISNAMKFTSEGSVTVTFRQMLLQGGKLDLMIRVKDTGVGMKPEFLERIFKPFEQEDASTTRRFGGTGLGMAISDQMVRVMGGQIVVESQPDVGSEFTVFLSLPVASAPQEEAPQKQPAQIEPVSRPMRLLMAEDNEINAMIAVEILQERGAQIEVAENGKIAEEKFAASPAGYYDAVLMDVQMPVMDGRAAARSIRAMPRPDAQRVPIYALSADAFVEDERLSREAGMNGHLSKPVNFDELWKILQQAVQESRQTN